MKALSGLNCPWCKSKGTCSIAPAITDWTMVCTSCGRWTDLKVEGSITEAKGGENG